MAAWVERNLCADPDDLKPCILRYRCRTGRCEFSARLLLRPPMSLRARASVRWHCSPMPNASSPKPHIHHAISHRMILPLKRTLATEKRTYHEHKEPSMTTGRAVAIAEYRAKALDLPAQRSVSVATPGHPGLAPVAAPTGAATSGENTMTNKPSKEEVGIACREGHQPQELKGDGSEAAGDHEARSSRRPSQCPGRRDHRRTLQGNGLAAPFGSRRTRGRAKTQGPRHPVREGRAASGATASRNR